MQLFTINFPDKSAQEFFETLKENEIEVVVDMRLNNQFSSGGFTKKDDLAYFLAKLCGARYEHDLILAPTDEQLDAFERPVQQRREYIAAYRRILEIRQAVAVFYSRYGGYKKVCLLCGMTPCKNSYLDVLLEMLRERNAKLAITRL